MPPSSNCQAAKQVQQEQMEKLPLQIVEERNVRNKKQEAQSSNCHQLCFCMQHRKRKSKKEK
eukprot:2630944-Ditylum_brightwellii.AAC.1